MLSSASLTLCLLPLLAVRRALANDLNPCKFGQPCWPSTHEWTAFNHTLGGKLVNARPSAAPCHGPDFNEAACESASTNFLNQVWRAENPGALQDLYWENGDTDCWIDGPRNVSCPQGFVPTYVAQVEDVDDVRASVEFAKQHRLSTTVKNSGHDFLGRSFGEGTFNIATIKLKGIEFEDNYRLPGAPHDAKTEDVVHVAAGESWYYVYKAADQHQKIVVGGTAYTVGAAGGWILGGGHSSLSPQYGLGVDNVLQFEIVTPDGALGIANAYQNEDLFWALRGGGPGFGVVTKVTYRTHPALSTSTIALVNFTYTQPSYHEFAKTFLSAQPTLSSANISGYAWPSPTGLVATLYLYNSFDITTVNNTLQSLWDLAAKETTAGRSAFGAVQFSPLPKFFDQFTKLPETVRDGGGTAFVLGSRLFPRSTFENAASVEALATLFTTTQAVPMLLLVGGGAVSTVEADETAVHPSWRTAIQHIILVAGWNSTTPVPFRGLVREYLTNQTQIMGSIAPDSGSYHNEADRNEPNWRETFWGTNYPRLLRTKHSVDPAGLFTCAQCVGYSD